MLTKLELSAEMMPTIKKSIKGKDRSNVSAFPCGTKITFTVETPRVLGASAVVLRIAKDGDRDRDIPLDFIENKKGVDVYETTLDTSLMCGTEENGLFYYEFLFLRGYDTLFTDTHNFVDHTLVDNSAGRFILLVHKQDYTTPDWFGGRIMYHIFVDRFAKGDREVPVREDAIINEDWENGIMQYPEKAGDKLANNMFFGGTLWGVAEKLDYLKSLGVGVVYLSPIFEAYSNHKYDTGNYLKVDEMFGGDEAFEYLLKKAAELDIKIILDGVFNHTGDDSIYFDKYGRYGNTGAYSDPFSQYRNWYRFRRYPDEYEDWWGIKILPKLNHTVEDCRRYFTGKGGVCEKYVNMGIGGWRLDVADELSDEFLDELRETVKNASDGNAIIIGEVWENAAEKISYSRRRRYLRGDQLDSVMNYPLRNGILDLLIYRDASLLGDVLKSIYASYPKCVCDSLMNLLGTHDTERILTMLGDCGRDVSDISNKEFSTMRLDAAAKKRGVALLKLASVIQYTVYGVPSVFYGDEAGIEGYSDPFCRKTYPWGRENKELLTHYRKLGKIRTENKVFAKGEFEIEYCKGAVIIYSRYDENGKITVAVNASEAPFEYKLNKKMTDLLTGKGYNGEIAPASAVILK
ncbi:MAG: glycoside hydrolase family 13 protein [Ruminococcaceae bacterium]|nr:glycoside hydrolase family 13 protein [Oscillospiraceae bacterium]